MQPDAPQPFDDDGEAERRFVVCGDTPLALRLVRELTTRYNAQVAVIVPSLAANHAPQIARQPNTTMIEAQQLDEEALRRAGLAEAAAIGLVAQDDAGNVDAALLAQELNPGVRIVMRMFNLILGESMTQMLDNCVVLSSATIAAPAFVAAALGDPGAATMEFGGQTLIVGRRSDVRPEDVVTGLAIMEGREEPELLPADPNQADTVLARYRAPRIRPVRRQRHRLRRLFLLVGRRLRLVLLFFLLLLLAGTAVQAWARHIGWAQAAYDTVLTALAGANPDRDASGLQQVIQTVLTLASIAIIPVITALVVDVLVKARLALAAGGLTGPTSGHVVVIGLGNVGTRVIRALAERGVEVVAIERDPQAVGVTVAQELRIPLILADGHRTETLKAASIGTSRALVVVSTDDVVNLETALMARALKPDLRVVLRLFDGEFADRVDRAFGISTSRSVSYLAAPAFAAAMLDRQVMATIPLRRRVLLVAEVPVAYGSEQDGRPAIELQRGGESRLLAVRTGRGQQTLWAPSPGRRISPTDHVIVVVTRAGLESLLARTAPPAETDPDAPPARRLPFPPIEPLPFGALEGD